MRRLIAVAALWVFVGTSPAMADGLGGSLDAPSSRPTPSADRRAVRDPVDAEPRAEGSLGESILRPGESRTWRDPRLVEHPRVSQPGSGYVHRSRYASLVNPYEDRFGEARSYPSPDKRVRAALEAAHRRGYGLSEPEPCHVVDRFKDTLPTPDSILNWRAGAIHPGIGSSSCSNSR
ncbi:MAG: hypothetical protein EB084_05835 [Proteobacteria bacterium]|nr:hypothetical protein [Pseudomonadota bacterium]